MSVGHAAVATSIVTVSNLCGDAVQQRTSRCDPLAKTSGEPPSSSAGTGSSGSHTVTSSFVSNGAIARSLCLHT